MDPSIGQLLLAALGILVGIVQVLSMFLLKHLWNSVIALQLADNQLIERIGSMRSSMDEHFVRTSALQAALVPLHSQLGRIEAKLDQKVDRHECHLIHRMTVAEKGGQA